MRSQVRTMLLVLGTFLGATPSFAVMCGDLITDAQILTADLNCMTDPAVRIGEGGSLDMDGFKISCGSAADGVLLDGLGAKLSNGVISGCSFSGVRASGGKHKIERVLVSSSGTGFSIISTGNKISNCAALNNSGQGFYVPAPENSLSHLIARGNSGIGLEAGTGHNKITDVSIVANTAVTGMHVVGEGSKISKVRISNANIGFSLSGNLNKVSEVTSLKHAFRGFDISGTGNQVKKSVASTTFALVGAGFAANGSNNSISGCRSTGATKGIIVSGGDNVVSKNKVFGAGDHGIELLGSNNSATGNFAVGSGTFDLFENISGCANDDVWEKNVGTRNDSCIE